MEIQYMAGIFDSEGYVRIRKTNNGDNFYYTPEVRLYMTNKTIIKLFSDRYKVPIKEDNRGKNRLLAYHITLGVKKLRECKFIEEILPFLNEKRLQLTEVKNIIEGKDKQKCYENYLKYKKVFNHPIKESIISPAYLAGIIDGDGWISMFNAGKGKSFYNKYRVGLQQRYKPMIEFMTKYSGYCSKCKIYDVQNHIQTWSWQATTSDVLYLLEIIYPFLIEKKLKCLTLINYIKRHLEFKKFSKESLQIWK